MSVAIDNTLGSFSPYDHAGMPSVVSCVLSAVPRARTNTLCEAMNASQTQLDNLPKFYGPAGARQRPSR